MLADASEVFGEGEGPVDEVEAIAAVESVPDEKLEVEAMPTPPTPPLPPPPMPPPDVPPPAPAAPPSEAGSEGGRSERLPIGVTALVPGGRISWYRKGMFEASCRNPDHKRCVLTRKSVRYAASSAAAPRGGRPLGFWVAWLGSNHQPDKAGHWRPEAMDFDHATRARCRERLREMPGGVEILAMERELVAGEPEEPLESS